MENKAIEYKKLEDNKIEDKQTAIIVGINIKTKDSDETFGESMQELANLAEACEVTVIGELTQNAERINTSHYLGKGKIEELAIIVKDKAPDLVIFNDELSPSQIRNLEDLLECKVIDRTVLILDIFASRAKTKEAQLQVEVARLQYMLPRLIGYGLILSRQGGSGSGLATRGAGETKLELDRRKIEDRISRLNKELELLVARRKNQRVARKKSEIPVVALVGYTNAGKSTVMNSIIEMYSSTADKLVFEKDMLFATLETSVRSVELPDNKKFLLTDTVGFISKLPHHLVKAFRSTLEEVTEADLLIHVVDYSNPNYEQQIKVTEATLKELGVANIPIIYAFNKIDLLEKRDFKDSLEQVFISARSKISVDRLVETIKQNIFVNYVKCNMLIPHEKGDVLSYLNENAHIIETKYENEGVIISLECKEADYNRYSQYLS